MDHQTLPLLDRADLVVCGGGTAGAFCALAAAEAGADVLLVEQFGSLGGSATNALVLPIMHNHMEENPQCSYLAKKLLDRLKKEGGCSRDGLNFDPVLLAFILEEMCLSAGVRILYHTFLAGAVCKDGLLQSAVVANKAGLSRIEGKLFADCTGDGDLSVFAGAAFQKGNPETGKNQPVSLRYLVGGVDKEVFGNFILEESKRTGKTADGGYWDGNIYAAVTNKEDQVFFDLFDKAIRAGDLTEDDRIYWQLFPVAGREDTLAFNNPEFFEDCDGTDPYQLSRIQCKGKQAILRQMRFYRRYFKGFEKAYLSSVAPMVGVRESRNIQTRYLLTAKDLLEKRKFADGVCQSNYPVDIHGRALCFDLKTIAPPADGKNWYEIPYRSLVVKGIDNLLVAGRCLGAEFLVQSSLRVQHTCRATGEAAGIAAALCLQQKILPGELDGKEVRARMEALGAHFS